MVDFRPVTFNEHDTLTRDKVTAIVNNIDYLNEKMPDLRYAYGVTVNEGVKMLSGRFAVGGSKGRTFGQVVNLGNYFTPGCEPIVITSITSDLEDEVFLRVRGPGQMKPTSSQFIVNGILTTASGKKANIERGFFVDWLAIGY